MCMPFLFRTIVNILCCADNGYFVKNTLGNKSFVPYSILLIPTGK